jgi:hypothetical protein
MGVTPQAFNTDKLKQYFDSQVQRYIIDLSRVGEIFRNDGKLMQTYFDRTGNLRASIGYTIAKDGTVSKVTGGGSSEGVNQGKAFGEQLVSGEPDDSITLVGYAGMEYAQYVEARNLDVVTGPAKRAMRKIRSILTSKR